MNQPTVNIRFYFGGVFEVVKSKVVYTGGQLQLMAGIRVDNITYDMLSSTAKKLVGDNEFATVWYVLAGKSLTFGRSLMKHELDIPLIIKSVDKDGGLNLYVTVSTIPPLINQPGSPRTKLPVYPASSKSIARLKRKSKNTLGSPTTNLPAFKPLVAKPTTSGPLKTSPIPTRGNPRPLISEKCERTTGNPLTSSTNQLISSNNQVTQLDNHSIQKNTSLQIPKLKTWKKIDFHESEKKKAEQFIDLRLLKKTAHVLEGEKVSNEGVKQTKERSKTSRNKSKGKTVDDSNCPEVDVNDELDVEYDLSDGSDCPEVDVDFVVGEEDIDEEELFETNDNGNILGQVDSSLRGVKQYDFRGESDDDSDELRSLEGSDSEEDHYPVFNAETDFRKDINLVVGLKFTDNDTLRKALRHHAVEKRYDFYYLHSNRNRVTTYCKYKCDCKWDKVKGRIVGCKCKPNELKCRFKVHATKLKGEATTQIKAMTLRHTCSLKGLNKKVTAEYLAERYLEDWRENPTWLLDAFKNRVYRDLGVDVKYGQCWLARARAKLLIYGDGAHQYLRVWDYVALLRKYNPGSSTFVMVEGIERPPPFFQRMYICLKACKDGFLAGCRPLIGVDGCHLKGAYPGMCLVAIGKDGNNNLYPIAWAVVEVENGDTWSWFLKLLVEDLVKEEGEGLTFMSDRQKGLLDAFKVITPKADLRFCVRHIWANFKLQFPGQAYKDAFWKAARTTSQAEFDAQMDGIKFLSPGAHSYLAAIPPKHWSRHAFPTTCKSNMLLNNLCESFNYVLKEARDKPILTFMEWIRRYIMKKRCEKRDGVQRLDTNLMPYVGKYLQWAETEARFCVLTPARVDQFEVDYRGETYVVDLGAKTCGCNHWGLSGLPCPHAIACVLRQRGDPRDYVHEAYSKRRYMMAYEPAISAMPGIKQWPKVDQPQPLPPPFRKMPGRPNSKKRRKEANEGTSTQVKRARKSRACGKCGKLGHNIKTCKNALLATATASAPATASALATTTAPPPKPSTRPQSKSEWSKKMREKTAKRKAQKEAYAAAGLRTTEMASTTVTSSTQTNIIHSSQTSVNGREAVQQGMRNK